MSKGRRNSNARTGASQADRGRPSRRTIVSLVLVVVLMTIIGVLLSPTLKSADQPAEPDQDYTLINTYPHDPNAFTQGLEYHDGFLYEGTGQYGASTVRKTNLETGEVLQNLPLDPQYFGEGIAIRGDELVQLTWQSGVGFVRDLKTFQERRRFEYEGEGWGLCYDGSRFIMSDGTSTLRFLDPESLEKTGSLAVIDRDLSVRNLNELEIVGKELFANIWGSDRIARISLETGAVNGWINLAGLRREVARRTGAGRRSDVLNGIAYDAEHDRLFVTGKNWPVLFEIKLTRP